jgi:type I restriction enzyme S subunit
LHTVKLSEIVTVIKGKKVDFSDDHSAVPVIDIQAIRSGNPQFHTYDKRGVLCKENDVLIVWDGANCGTVGTGLSGVLGSTVAALRIEPDSAIDHRFLKIYLDSQFSKLNAKTTGSTIPHLDRQFLLNMDVPILPKDEQQKIVDILDKAQSAIQKRKESIKLADEYLKSVFDDMFGDPATNPKGWEKRSVGSFCNIKIGPFGSLLHAEDYIVNGYPLVNPSHIINGEIVLDSTLTVSEKKFKELSSYHLDVGDIVLGRRGEIGRCAVVKDNSLGLLCGTGSMIIRIQKKCIPIFLQYQIYNTSLKSILENNAKGITMKNLNTEAVENLMVITPPLDLQNQFADIVQKVETLKKQQRKSLEELETTFKSLMQRAFDGKLI